MLKNTCSLYQTYFLLGPIVVMNSVQAVILPTQCEEVFNVAPNSEDLTLEDYAKLEIRLLLYMVFVQGYCEIIIVDFV